MTRQASALNAAPLISQTGSKDNPRQMLLDPSGEMCVISRNAITFLRPTSQLIVIDFGAPSGKPNFLMYSVWIGLSSSVDSNTNVGVYPMNVITNFNRLSYQRVFRFLSRVLRHGL